MQVRVFRDHLGMMFVNNVDISFYEPLANVEYTRDLTSAAVSTNATSVERRTKRLATVSGCRKSVSATGVVASEMEAIFERSINASRRGYSANSSQ